MNKVRSVLFLALVGACALTVVAAAPSWAGPPESVNLHGTLLGSDGEPLSGSRAFVLRFFDAETDGTQLGPVFTGMVVVSDGGVFNLPVVMPPEALAAPAVWYELGIDTDTPPDGDAESDVFPQRVRVHSVPFALEAVGVTHVDVSRVGAGTVTEIEFGFLAGVVQPIQSALDAKANAEDFSNVDNTSDMDKPVSAAQQEALDKKLPRASEAFIVVEVTSNERTNGSNLRAAYAAAAALTPFGAQLSATNRAVVIVPPGRYNLGRLVGIGPTGLTLDAEFVDLVGLSTARENQYLYSTSMVMGGLTPDTVLLQTASDVRIENLVFDYIGEDTGKFAYYPNASWGDGKTGSPPQTRIRNCEFHALPNMNSMRTGVEYAGRYEHCLGAGQNAFGGDGGTASGLFIHCEGGRYAFAGNGGTASGDFVHCSGGPESFGAFGTASGRFTDCTGGNYAFGGGAQGVASGEFINCTGADYTFGGAGGTASGRFVNCTGGHVSLGGGLGGDSTGGVFQGCHMRGTVYGANFNGVMEDCRWDALLMCAEDARIYRSTILGNVDLKNVSAGIAHSMVQGNIINTVGAVFNEYNLVSGDVR